jgi:hypothetical protein
MIVKNIKEFPMTDNELLLNALRVELAPIQAQLDGLLLIHRSLVFLRQETRALKTAFNDFARTNVTVGEIEALHTNVNRVMAENAALEVTLERKQ